MNKKRHKNNRILDPEIYMNHQWFCLNVSKHKYYSILHNQSQGWTGQNPFRGFISITSKTAPPIGREENQSAKSLGLKHVTKVESIQWNIAWFETNNKSTIYTQRKIVNNVNKQESTQKRLRGIQTSILVCNCQLPHSHSAAKQRNELKYRTCVLCKHIIYIWRSWENKQLP